MTDFIWDGGNDDGQQVAAGMYTLELKATDDQGKTISPTTYVGSLVASIGQEGADLKVGLSDGRSIFTTDIVKWLAI
jgi:flagellar hook assembly protein FlgD